MQPVSVNLWAGRAVVAEAHFDAHHNVFAQRRSRLKVERAVLCGAAACYAWDARLRPWAALEYALEEERLSRSGRSGSTWCHRPPACAKVAPLAPLATSRCRGSKRFVLAPAAAALPLRLYPEAHPQNRHTQLHIDASGAAEEGETLEGGPLAALEAVLHPGEVLYLPPYVFHRVGGGGGGSGGGGEGEGLSLSVNVFSESVEHLAAGSMAAVGLPPSVQPAVGLDAATCTRLLACWLRHLIFAAVAPEGAVDGPTAAAAVAAAFLAPQVARPLPA